MRRIHLESSFDFSFLPPVYSAMNALSAVILLIAYWHIKNKRVREHQKMMTIAMSTSFIFLLCYVLYHITTPETLYCKEGIIRYVYFSLLITHVVLAAVSFPFALCLLYVACICLAILEYQFHCLALAFLLFFLYLCLYLFLLLFSLQYFLHHDLLDVHGK